MKPEEEFVYEDHIVEELKGNNKNLKTLLTKLFLFDIEKQKKLALNYIHEPQEKQSLLKYLNSS